jgi:ribosomal protein L40E
MKPTRRNPILDDDQDQDEYDRTPICPRCEAVCSPGLDYCQTCGRKVKVDRPKKGERDGEVDFTDYLKRSFGSRLAKFREDARLDNEETESLMEGQ